MTYRQRYLKHSVAYTAWYRTMQLAGKARPCDDGNSSPAAPVLDAETSVLNYRRI